MKLSIIIPYYEVYDYIKELMKMLEPQLTNEIEVIIVDDGCNEHRLDKFKAKVIHLDTNSGGAGKPRNIGLENASGDYIAFIDADDLITNDYIVRILKKIEKNPDIIYLSWKCKGNKVIMDKRPPKWNCAVWCRVYKRSLIGNVRFREDLKIAEDYLFNQQLKPLICKSIKEVVYIYNNGRPGSLMNQ